MAKQLIRYLLQGDGTIPPFVEDGGYFPVNEELVGRSVDETIRYLPSSIVRMTRADLVARITAIGPVDANGVLLDAVAIDAMAQAFLDAIGMSNLA